jgi:thioredoxin-related protein
MRRLTLDKATNLSLLVASAMLTVALGQRLWAQHFAAIPTPLTYDTGEQFPEIQNVRYEDNEKTVVLFIASTCRYCTESMPFYAQLTAKRRELRTKVVAFGFEPEPTLKEYLAKHGVEVDHIQSSMSRKYKFAATPTLVVLNSKGVVLNQWIGALGEREADARRVLNLPVTVRTG